jgi:hypothetical protein
MEKSESIKNIASALTKFQNEVKAVTKDGKNPFFKSSYATLGNIINTITTPLVKNGLSYSQLPSGENGLTTILMHSSGEYIYDTVKMTPKDNTPQGQGSAITYMRRYALSALLGLSTDEDDDGNAASRKREVYDTSAVDDKAEPTVSYDEEPHDTPTEKPEVAVPDDLTEQKKLIIKLLKKDNPKLDARDKKELERLVADKTELALIDANFPEIIRRLSN